MRLIHLPVEDDAVVITYDFFPPHRRTKVFNDHRTPMDYWERFMLPSMANAIKLRHAFGASWLGEITNVTPR
jgi:hypothetical protein